MKKILFSLIFVMTMMIMATSVLGAASSGYVESENTYADIAAINTLLGDSSIVDSNAEKESDDMIDSYDFSTIAATNAEKEN